MIPDSLMHAGVLVDLGLATVCFAILALGIWIWRNPEAFWNEFNPYLKPHRSFTLSLGRVIGSLWSFGAVLGCIITIGNAVRDGVHHHWLK
ncbi:MAG: hypothetical protein DMG64_15550 [Acidobacteria bacterium]|nr:MAG: hypothetical protein DMG64_15550 [Acidobacteriota bacterium]